MNGIWFPRVKPPTNSDAFAPANSPSDAPNRQHSRDHAVDGETASGRRKRKIIYGSIGLVVLWIVGSIICGKREKPIPVTTETAMRKTILQIVSATGKIQPETEVKISPEVAGEIIELPVDDGCR